MNIHHTRPCSSPPLQRRAFTLAEVLITLVIIGVIAAFTIPTLINNTKKQEYVSALKKTYSTLATVTNKIMNDEGMPRGDIGGWATSSGAVFNQYKKYLSFVKECGVGVDGCYGQGSYKLLSSNDKDPTWGSSQFPKIILSDGTLLIFVHRSNDCTSSMFGSNDLCSSIGVDINGEKPPNIWGRDAFIFVIKENGLHPAGCDTAVFDVRGQNSTCKVLRESAMNY